MLNESQSTNDESSPGRWMLIRDIAVLQVKLVVDGLRDFILVPVSLVAGLISLFRSGDAAGNEFYDLLWLGRRSERWINLFGAADRIPPRPGARDHFPEEDIDALVRRVEAFVAGEYRKGGATRQAKEQLDELLDSIGKRRERRARERRPP